MWRIAGDCGIEQTDGSFLHQRIHALDPSRPLGSTPYSSPRSVRDEHFVEVPRATRLASRRLYAVSKALAKFGAAASDGRRGLRQSGSFHARDCRRFALTLLSTRQCPLQISKSGLFLLGLQMFCE
jgi:hypothetical protein